MIELKPDEARKAALEVRSYDVQRATLDINQAILAAVKAGNFDCHVQVPFDLEWYFRQRLKEAGFHAGFNCVEYIGTKDDRKQMAKMYVSWRE